jgi:hypothetical protein
MEEPPHAAEAAPQQRAMSAGHSRHSVASSVRRRQEAELAAAEERERVATEIAAAAARASRLAAAELAAARAEVEAEAAVAAARAAAAEADALRSNASSSVCAETIVPTQTSSCWPGRPHETGWHSGQPPTPTAVALLLEACPAAALQAEVCSAAASQAEAHPAAVLLWEACTAVALQAEARPAAVLLWEARTAVAPQAEVRPTAEAAAALQTAARWRPSGCGRGLLSLRLRWPITNGRAGMTESAPLTGGAAPFPRTGTKVTTGSQPSSGTAGGLPSPRPTTSSGPQS